MQAFVSYGVLPKGLGRHMACSGILLFMEQVWTTKAILAWIEAYLAQHGDASPASSAQWLVAEALGCSRMQLFLDLERPLSEEERAVLRDYTRRRGLGEPLQYITGTAPFRHISVKVQPGVLIPRPETEVLVSEALSLLPAPKRAVATDSLGAHELLQRFGGSEAEGAQAAGEGDAPVEQRASAVQEEARPCYLVADVCTGSGCIAASLAYEHPDVRVIATDISPEAVGLARSNVELLGLAERVEVCCGDLCAPLGEDANGLFSLVLSNPPYIPSGLLEELPKEVAAFEPALALDGGADGLDIFKRLLPQALRLLKGGGAFLCELHEDCLDAAAGLAQAAGFAKVRVVRDLAGKPRVLIAFKTDDGSTGKE